MRVSLILIFLLAFSYLGNAQTTKNKSNKKALKDSLAQEYSILPSLRWNATAMLNPWFPAASFVYEHPLLPKVSLETEAGILLPYYKAEYENEQFRGIRVRLAPKFYFTNKSKNLFYLRAQVKYDYAKSIEYNRLLDASQSYQQIHLVTEHLHNIGFLFYQGYTTHFWKNRFVFDFSIGLGYTQWVKKDTIPEGFINQPNFQFGLMNSDRGAIPVLNFNIQLGYRF